MKITYAGNLLVLASSADRSAPRAPTMRTDAAADARPIVVRIFGLRGVADVDRGGASGRTAGETEG
jgi:hypothetical protein